MKVLKRPRLLLNQASVQNIIMSLKTTTLKYSNANIATKLFTDKETSDLIVHAGTETKS